MIELTINNKKISVAPGTTILKAAEELSIGIPTLCYAGGLPPKASCMMCAVKDKKSGKIIPSCESIAETGMDIETDTAEIIGIRKHAIELLLSEHKGECEAPCERTCPVHPDIPEILVLAREGNFADAEKLIRKEMPFAGILCAQCSAPCEKACRRKRIDRSVSIKDIIQLILKNNKKNSRIFPDKKKKINKKVAIAGSGPAGISCAYFLLLKGYDVSIFRSEEYPAELQKEIIENEINIIRSLDAEILNYEKQYPSIQDEYNAIAVNIKDNVQAQSNTNFFECTDAENTKDILLHSIKNGKETAGKIHHFLTEDDENKSGNVFHSIFGKTADNDNAEWLKCADPGDGSAELLKTNSTGELQHEAARCMRCGCAKKDDCRLRDLAAELNAERSRYSGEQISFSRKIFNDIIIEPGKCIKCGICVRISKEAGWSNGFAFLKRGFDMTAGLPFDMEPEPTRKETVMECVKRCPTGALSVNRCKV